MAEEDQETGSNDQTGADTQSDVQKDQEKEADQKGQDKVQSTEDKTSEPATYKVGNRELSADDLHKEYQSLQKDYTKKSQRLADVEKAFGEGAQTERAARGAAKEVPSDVREAIVDIVRPEIQRELKAQRDSSALEQSFESLARTWDGAGGKPKYDPEADRTEILEYMGAPGSKVLDPQIVFEILHKEEIRDWDRKQALTKQKGGKQTEKTGGTGERKPKRKQAKSLGEASDMFLERQANV